MNKTTVIALTAAVWLTGIGATFALASVAKRTSTVPEVHRVVLAPPHAMLQPITPEPERIITLPTIEIVGSPPIVAKARDTKPRVRHCSDWQPLEQGSNAVQICD